VGCAAATVARGGSGRLPRIDGSCLSGVKALIRKALDEGWVVEKPTGRRRKPGHRLAGVSAWRIADLAAALAGRKRPALREEWVEHLSGLPASQKVGAALGFVVAAIRCRLRDAADLGESGPDN
jgi:hypothetical protein